MRPGLTWAGRMEVTGGRGERETGRVRRERNFPCAAVSVSWG